jgi:hypothetical protein
MVISQPRALPAAILLPLVLAGAAGCDIVSADLRHTETAEWRKTFELQPGGRVEVANVNGRIDVEPSSSNVVEVVAHKMAKGATPEAAREALNRIEIREDASPSSIRIETRHQRGGGFFNRGGGEVNYTLRVPATAAVRFATVNGRVQLTGLKGPIEAETTNGGIVGRDIAGEIRASSTNGGVDIELQLVPEGGAKLDTVNGGIKLRLPEDAKTTISAEVTNGGISTSGLPLVTTESSRRRVEGQLNGGGPRIRVTGVNGGIRIAPR